MIWIFYWCLNFCCGDEYIYFWWLVHLCMDCLANCARNQLPNFCSVYKRYTSSCWTAFLADWAGIMDTIVKVKYSWGLPKHQSIKQRNHITRRQVLSIELYIPSRGKTLNCLFCIIKSRSSKIIFNLLIVCCYKVHHRYVLASIFSSTAIGRTHHNGRGHAIFKRKWAL